MVVRRFLVASGAIALVLLGGIGSIQAQGVPAAMSIDSSFGVGYLLGWQMFNYIIEPEHGDAYMDPRTDPPTRKELRSDPYGIYRTEFSPRMAVVSGFVEWSPLPFASGRVAGALSVADPHIQFTRTMLDTFKYTAKAADTEVRPTNWDAVPDFKSWEAAGLYHLYREGGYRFSIVGGYRQEDWTFLGTPEDATNLSASLHNRYTSHIPFLALQTAMYFPWWKARFEVLGSPFMSKKISSKVSNRGTLAVYNGWANGGGLIEFFLEGTVAVTSMLRLGLHARYTYQELYGWVTKTVSGATEAPGTRDHNLGFNSRDAILGLTFTAVF